MKTLLIFLSVLLFSSLAWAESYDLKLGPQTSYNANSKNNLFSPYTKTYKSENQDKVKDVVTKISKPNTWMKNELQLQGLVGSFILAGSLTGMTEGYHFNNNDGYFVNSGNYHFYDTIKRISYISTGYFSYATVENNSLSWYSKSGRILGSALISRDFNEWGYKFERYNNPFDYSKERNQRAIVYFTFIHGKITDMYLGVGPASGPIVDITCLALGIILLHI